VSSIVAIDEKVTSRPEVRQVALRRRALDRAVAVAGGIVPYPLPMLGTSRRPPPAMRPLRPIACSDRTDSGGNVSTAGGPLCPRQMAPRRLAVAFRVEAAHCGLLLDHRAWFDNATPIPFGARGDIPFNG